MLKIWHLKAFFIFHSFKRLKVTVGVALIFDLADLFIYFLYIFIFLHYRATIEASL